MKRKLTYLGLIIAVVLSFSALCGCGMSRAEIGNYALPSDDGYVMTDLDVTVDATAGDGSAHIIEKYTFDYSEFSQGFFRDIPLNSGEKVRDLKVYDAKDFSGKYEVSHYNNDILRVKVGKEGKYVLGRNVCTIEYTLIMPKHVEYPDALVLNVIGQGWTCAIEHADISVKLPAETIEKPWYRYGQWGSASDAVYDDKITDSEAVAVGVKEYKFSINDLRAFEGLTVYYFLPEGALGSSSDNTVWIILGVSVLLIALAVLFKFLFGKSKPLAPVTNYYPPKHVGAGDKSLPMDPVDMGYLIDNTCQGSDVTSLIFYFASKGYLELIEPNSKENKSKDFKLVKLCDLPQGTPKYQKTFFNKIFSSGDTVTVSQLTNKTYTAVQSVQSQIAAKYKGKLLDKKPRVAEFVLGILTVAYAFFVTFIAGLQVSSHLRNWAGVVALFPVVISTLLGTFTVNNWLKFGKVKCTALLVALGAVAILLSLPLLIVNSADVLSLASRIIMIVTVAASSAVIPFITRRTEYYTSELNEVMGFKDFLMTAEKDRLEMLLEENPQYYYDILPYANVLGVSDIWQDKFKGLTVEPPTYYRGETVFTLILFNSYYRNSYRAYSSAAVSRPSSSSRSGGGFSGGGGGGFSGGGFGGGGGGRW